MARMRLSEIAASLHSRILPPNASADREITRIYAGDRISDLIDRATPDTLLVTNVSNAQLIRVAELMDVPGICVVGGEEPAPELVEAAGRTGTAILVCPDGLFETCGRLYQAVCGREPGKP
jgi:hypothetical protein